MARPIKLDRDALHAYLYKRTDHMGRVQIKITDLAGDLGIRRDHLGRIIKEMVNDGRMKKTSSTFHNVGIYTITDPDTWAPGQTRKRLAWQ
jgi:DNA-binding MarR family transcriptional regulator